ncbi:MAG: hypothetical protein C0601_07325 [Candidatus Muiribacterium halophilum]|uniref:Uncharacterized protein n=1 Tax=Muiribacterium halophilum TaxID=2053465 RepID=A0A2N5ZFS1_MUIH1|nr:MAG: hypothetical protein C0601_07325 [Candidatus Muirbacterium halophilum]
MRITFIVFFILSLFILVHAKQDLYCVFLDSPEYRQYNQKLFKGINDFCQNKDYRLISFSYKEKKDIRDRIYKIHKKQSAIVFCGPWLKDICEWLYKKKRSSFSDIMLFDSYSRIKEISCLTIDRRSAGIILGLSTCIINEPYLMIINQDLPFLNEIYKGIEEALNKRKKQITLKRIKTDILVKKNFYKYVQDMIKGYNGIIFATGPISGLSAFSGEILNKRSFIYGDLNYSESKYPSIKIISNFNLTKIMTRFLERCLYRKKGLDMKIDIKSSEFIIDRRRLNIRERLQILKEGSI